VGKKRKVFSRKGRFSANEKDPPIGQPVKVLTEHFMDEPEPALQTQPAMPTVSALNTDSYNLNNVRVRVLKPDPAFIRDITERLRQLDSAVDKLNANIDTKD
jgi:hypothetical protein